MKRLWKRFFTWLLMTNVPPEPPASPYVDMGVSVATPNLGTFGLTTQPTYLKRVSGTKAKSGTYRFDEQAGSYFFSKADAGLEVVMCFLDHGSMHRRTHIIGL